MIGEGREDQKDNDLFFVCGLIDYIARKTKNKRADIVNWLGRERLQKICDLADVYHCDNIDRVCEDFIEEANIPDGTFDNVADCRYAIPSHWDIAKVYNSFLSPKIDDYNSSLYYDNPSYLLECYLENKIL